MVAQNNAVSVITKGVAMGVMLMLAWLLGNRSEITVTVPASEKKAEEIITMEGSFQGFLPTTGLFSFSVPLGDQPHQVGYMAFQETIQPGWAQGALPTELWYDRSQITWIGDPYGPRLTGWSQDGTLLTAIDLPFLLNESASGKEIVGFTVKPAQDNGWFILNNQNKKIYHLHSSGELVSVFSIPMALSDSRVLLNISPFFEVIRDEWFFVTIESTSQPYSPQDGLAGGGYLETRWESFFLSQNGEKVGPLPENTSVLPFEEGFVLWSYEQSDLILKWYQTPTSMQTPTKTWKIRRPEWHYGGMIGSDTTHHLYFWANRGIIGIISTDCSMVQYFQLPEQDAFPVTVSADGEIGYIIPSKRQLVVHLMKVDE